MIRIEHLSFSYHAESEYPVPALQDVSLSIGDGEFVVIVGHNGSGKSTLAKQLNALLLPTRGDVWVDEINTREKSRVWDVRQRVGMVFQNPDNQIVSTVVEDDVAFGPENLGVPAAEIQVRVDDAMQRMGIADLRDRAPHLLSGGQKQRVAIAGVLAMRSRYLVLDEPTSLLDPEGRAEVLAAAQQLHREGLAVIIITHFMHEAIGADRVVVMDGGRIVLQGTPPEVFTRAEKLRELQLDVPLATQIALRLRELGLDVRTDILSVEELLAELCP